MTDIFKDRLWKIQRDIERLENNPAPTVPIYDLAISPVTWSYDGVHTVSVTFPSVIGHVYALTVDNRDIFVQEQTITATTTSTTLAINNLDFLFSTHGVFGSDYTDAQAAGFIFSAVLFDRTANQFNNTRDGYGIAVATFKYGTASNGIEYTPVTWSYDGNVRVNATFQTLNGLYDSYGVGYFLHTNNNQYPSVSIPQSGGFSHGGGGIWPGDITGNGTVQTTYRDVSFYNGMHRVCMLEWRRNPNDGTPSHVFSWSTISARIFKIGVASSGFTWYPIG